MFDTVISYCNNMHETKFVRFAKFHGFAYHQLILLVPTYSKKKECGMQRESGKYIIGTNAC